MATPRDTKDTKDKTRAAPATAPRPAPPRLPQEPRSPAGRQYGPDRTVDGLHRLLELIVGHVVREVRDASDVPGALKDHAGYQVGHALLHHIGLTNCVASCRSGCPAGSRLHVSNSLDHPLHLPLPDGEADAALEVFRRGRQSSVAALSVRSRWRRAPNLPLSSNPPLRLPLPNVKRPSLAAPAAARASGGTSLRRPRRWRTVSPLAHLDRPARQLMQQLL